MFGREPKGQGAARAGKPRATPARAPTSVRAHVAAKAKKPFSPRSLRARLVLLALTCVGASAALVAGASLVGGLPLTLLAALAAAAVGLLAALRLHRSLARPVAALAASMDELRAASRFDGALDPAEGDELGRLAGGFSRMAEEVRARDEQVSTRMIELEREAAARARELSAAEHAVRVRSELLAAVSREIHAPTDGVKALAGMLADGEAPRRLAAAIARSSSSLLALTGDILDFPYSESGIELESGPAELSEIAEDVAALFWRAAAAKGLDLAVYVDPATPKTIKSDPQRLRQVLGVLVNNAVASTQAGGVLVEIEPDTPSSVRISVRDTGAGIPADRIGAAFDGLGLALCKRLVESMEGSFHLASQIGKGATFAFRIPARALEHAPVWPGARPEGRQALIAHDGVATRRALGRYLARAGYALCRAGDGTAPDLVIGGPARIAELAPAAPTICLAGYGDGASRALMERGLAQAALIQPLRRDELEALLRRVENRAPLADPQPEGATGGADAVPAPSPALPAQAAPARPRPMIAPDPVLMAAPGVIVTRAAPPPEVRSLLADLDEALHSDQLSLVYQPQFDREGQQILGVETLVRWTHPTRGVVSPVDFITVAEAWGDIRKLTDWVMTRAVEETAGLTTLQVAFNASALEFTDAGIVERIKALLDRTGFDPKRLEIEITETAILSNEDQVRDNMNELRDMGLKVALDDFGAGYSSLGHLRRYPFDKLKIDREFVTDCTGDVQSATVVHAVVSIGRALGMKVVAEGVETEQQRQFLKIAGVHAMQGYLFGKPVPIEVLKEMIAAPAERVRALA